MKGICKIFFIHWNQGKSSTFISHESGRKSLPLGFKHQSVLLLTRSGAPTTKLQIFTTIQVPFWNRSRWDLKTITAEASDSDEFRENRLFSIGSNVVTSASTSRRNLYAEQSEFILENSREPFLLWTLEAKPQKGNARSWDHLSSMMTHLSFGSLPSLERSACESKISAL